MGNKARQHVKDLSRIEGKTEFYQEEGHVPQPSMQWQALWLNKAEARQRRGRKECSSLFEWRGWKNMSLENLYKGLEIEKGKLATAN